MRLVPGAGKRRDHEVFLLRKHARGQRVNEPDGTAGGEKFPARRA
jgi:hypothetical protein